MSIRAWLLCSAVVLIPSVSFAHEIKVLASNLNLGSSRKTTVYLGWGHRLPVDDLVDAATLERYEIVAPDGKATALKKETFSLHANTVSLEQEGLHQAAVVRKANIFTHVLDSEGNKQLKKGPKSQYAGMKIDSSMRSKQFGKALIQVGSPGSEAPKLLGHDLELTPHSSPSGWKAGGNILMRVLFEGKPLPQAKATLHYVSSRPESEKEDPIQADAEGNLTLRMNEPGIWVIRVNHRRDAAESLREQFDVESYTATLTIFVQP